MLKVVLSAVGFVGLGIWSTSILWQTSPCKRAEVGAVPLYYAAKAALVIVEPLRGYKEDESEQSSQAARLWAQDQIAKWFYSRKDGHRHLCWSDPIYIMEQNGLIDHRGLVKIDIDGEKIFTNSQAAQKEKTIENNQIAPKATSIARISNRNTEEPSNLFGIIALLLSLILAGFVLLKWLAADKKTKELLNTLTGPLKDARILSTHQLPRKAIVPDTGADATDKSK